MMFDAVAFEVVRRDGSSVRDQVVDFDGDIDQVAKRMNRWLETIGAERRIWCADTGTDSFAFPRSLACGGRRDARGRDPDERAPRRVGAATA